MYSLPDQGLRDAQFRFTGAGTRKALLRECGTLYLFSGRMLSGKDCFFRRKFPAPPPLDTAPARGYKKAFPLRSGPLEREGSGARMDLLPLRRALLSVTDKTGLADFASFLSAAGVELVSTGGTFQALRGAGLPVLAVSEITGFPEILDGRVKTLHPGIHGGILADKENPAHLAALEEHGIRPFDLVCVNLYDFAGAARSRAPAGTLVEEIDIGGPCLLRAAAKNYHSLLVVPAVAWYGRVREELARNAMQAPLSLRREMAALAFAVTSAYDGLIASAFPTD